MNDEAVEAINHFSVLMEQQNSKINGVLEVVGDIQQKVARFDGIERDVTEVKQGMKAVRAVTIDTRHQGFDLEWRLSRAGANLNSWPFCPAKATTSTIATV